MSDLDREVAGVRCRDVLEQLSSYLDGDLTEEEARRIDNHLMGCDRCERFGGRLGEAVAALRREMSRATPLDAAVSRRLRERLSEV